jgi:ubiquinone/menaquinone biosynthesis C-methylase UbiE
VVRFRSLLALTGLGLAGFAAVTVARPAIDAARQSFRTSSSPGAGAYAALAGLFLGGYYDDIAADCAAALGATRSPKVLEIGPGPGQLAGRLLALMPEARWTGLDIDPAMLAATRRRLAGGSVDDRATLVEGDAAALPFDDASFDLVVSSLSAHHWPDALAAVREMRRVLRPGASALVYDVPEAWGHLETGSSGIGAIAAVDPTAMPHRFRGIGPVTLIQRVRFDGPPPIPDVARTDGNAVSPVLHSRPHGEDREE